MAINLEIGSEKETKITFQSIESSDKFFKFYFPMIILLKLFNITLQVKSVQCCVSVPLLWFNTADELITETESEVEVGCGYLK